MAEPVESRTPGIASELPILPSLPILPIHKVLKLEFETSSPLETNAILLLVALVFWDVYFLKFFSLPFSSLANS